MHSISVLSLLSISLNDLDLSSTLARSHASPRSPPHRTREECDTHKTEVACSKERSHAQFAVDLHRQPTRRWHKTLCEQAKRESNKSPFSPWLRLATEDKRHPVAHGFLEEIHLRTRCLDPQESNQRLFGLQQMRMSHPHRQPRASTANTAARTLTDLLACFLLYFLAQRWLRRNLGSSCGTRNQSSISRVLAGRWKSGLHVRPWSSGNGGSSAS
jgi:hypothetical protein